MAVGQYPGKGQCGGSPPAVLPSWDVFCNSEVAIRREPQVMNRDQGARELPQCYNTLILRPEDNRATQNKRSGAQAGRGKIR